MTKEYNDRIEELEHMSRYPENIYYRGNLNLLKKEKYL